MMTHVTPHHDRVGMGECISACLAAHRACLQTAAFCLAQTDETKAALVTVLQDCAQICQTSADFMLRGSPRHVRTCAICAEICVACAAACEAMSDTEELRRCADACRRCSRTCRAMASGEAQIS